MYEKILAGLDLGTARCYGSDFAPESGRYVLFLEKVDGAALWQLEEIDPWERAARWAARLHGKASPEPQAPLLRYDGAYFRPWLERARSFHPAGTVAALASAQRALARLAGLPAVFVHGEFYASNILVSPGWVCPVDWEMAGIGPGVLDLAALATAWEGADCARIVGAYADERGAPVDEEDLDAARLVLAVQWLGLAEGWEPPREHATDWLAEARRGTTIHSVKELVVNADDFGRSEAVNRGVAEAHERGIVTSASLMVRWVAAGAAAAYAGAVLSWASVSISTWASGSTVVGRGSRCTSGSTSATCMRFRRSSTASSGRLRSSSGARRRTSTLTSTCTCTNRSAKRSSPWPARSTTRAPDQSVDCLPGRVLRPDRPGRAVPAGDYARGSRANRREPHGRVTELACHPGIAWEGSPYGEERTRETPRSPTRGLRSRCLRRGAPCFFVGLGFR